MFEELQPPEPFDLDTFIEQKVVAAKAEILLMANRAREEMQRKFAFINRSTGQKRRFERERQLREQG